MDYFSITSKTIVEEAEKLWLETEILSSNKNFYLIRWNWKEIYFKSNDCWINTSLWYKIAYDKELTNIILEKNWYRIPKSFYLNKKDYNESILDKINLEFPLVTKPVDWGSWKWVFVNLKNKQELKDWIDKSFKYWDNIIIQNFIEWDEHRIVVIWDKVMYWIKRIPAFVVWDWEKTIKELIEIENKNPFRWDWYLSPLSFIKIDENLISFIEKSWYNLKSIPNKWEHMQLIWISNIWVWWTPENILDKMWNDLKEECIKIAKLVWLELVWIDIITNDIKKSLKDSKGAIIEINADPWFWWHKELFWINTSKELLKYVFDIK